MFFIGPPNLEKMKARRDLKGLIKALGYPKDWQVRTNARRILVEIGAPGVKLLIRALHDSNKMVCENAATALGEIGDSCAIEALICAASANDSALIALAKFDDPQAKLALEQIRKEKIAESNAKNPQPTRDGVYLFVRCKNCGQKYIFGRDALLPTPIDASTDDPSPGSPDLIVLLGREWSTLDSSAARKQKSAIRKLSAFLKTGKTRWWQCDICKETQPYETFCYSSQNADDESVFRKLVSRLGIFALSLFGVIVAIWGIVTAFGSTLQAVEAINSIFGFVKWWHALGLSVGIGLISYLLLDKNRGFLGTRIPGFHLNYKFLWGLMALPWVPVLTPLILPEKTAAEHIHIAVVVDASERMGDFFQDSASKWEVAQSATEQYLSKQPEGANYSLFVVGTDEPNLSEPCSGPDAPLVPWGSGNQAVVIDQISNILPNGGGSLTRALELARDALLEAPFQDLKSVYIVIGGPDECDQDSHFEAGFDPWENLLDSIEDIFAPINAHIHTDLIALVSEDVKNDLEEIYGVRMRLLGVQLASNQEELGKAVEAAIQGSTSRYQQSTATRTSTPIISITPQNSPSPILPTTDVPPLQIAISTIPVLSPTLTPLPIASMTATYLPPPTATRTMTPLPPTFTPTFTFTATSTFTPTDFPEDLSILVPNGGQDFNCSDAQECIIAVTILWVPESQTLGRYLSIWVQPNPDENYPYYVQQPPDYIGDGKWQSDEVYLGEFDTAPDTPFRIYALVTYESYPRGLELPALPSSLMEDSVDVTR